jgi:hypothetical protein
MNKTHITPGAAILVILLLSSGEYATVAGHFLAQFDGVVVARTEFVHYPPWTRNLTTKYVIREADGREHVFYADPSEGSGIDGFPIGTHLTKQRGHLDYEENGQQRDDFPLPMYTFWMILDFGLLVGCVILAIMIRARDQRTRELEAAVERGQQVLRDMDRER